MSSYAPMVVPEHKGKCHHKKSVTKIGQCKKHGYLRMRLKQVDAHAKMSDRRLSPGITNK